MTLAQAAVDNQEASGAKTIAAAGSRLAQKTPKPQPEPAVVSLPALSAEQIVERSVAARGGLAAWQRLQSLAFEGKLDAGKPRKDGGVIGMQNSPQGRAAAKVQMRVSLASQGEASNDKVIQLPFRMEMKRPLMTRIEIPFQGDTALQIFDGKQGWKVRPFLGRHEVEQFSPEEQQVAAGQQDLDGPLVNYAAKGTQIALDGTERVEGRDCYRLRLTLKGGEARRVWIDGQNFLDIRHEGAPRRWDGKMRAVVTHFRDFRPVDGLMIPYVMETSIEGNRATERIILDRVALNPPLDDTRFRKPL
jgi:hypothetical protein